MLESTFIILIVCVKKGDLPRLKSVKAKMFTADCFFIFWCIKHVTKRLTITFAMSNKSQNSHNWNDS